MYRPVRELWRERRGLAAVEYALLLGLVACAAVGAWRHLSWIVRIVAWISAFFIGRHPNW